jgi:hypothetical protein
LNTEHYIKPRDYAEVTVNERTVKIFTIEQGMMWVTCIQDESQNIAWQNPHLNYQTAHNDFVTFLNLLENRNANVNAIPKKTLKEKLFSFFK